MSGERRRRGADGDEQVSAVAVALADFHAYSIARDWVAAAQADPEAAVEAFARFLGGVRGTAEAIVEATILLPHVDRRLGAEIVADLGAMARAMVKVLNPDDEEG